MSKERIIQVIVSMLAVIGLLYGRLVSFPDAVSRVYGVPLNWGTHQLVSIVGPVDIWSVNLTYLAIDLVIWLLIIQVISTVVSRRQVKRL